VRSGSLNPGANVEMLYGLRVIVTDKLFKSLIVVVMDPLERFMHSCRFKALNR